jgi:hypothetical protein
MKTNTTITYTVGDLVNGDYTTATSLKEALQIYKDDTEAGAKSAFDDSTGVEGCEDRSFEDFLGESKKFHYVAKITTTITTDEDGDEEIEESREVIEGGTLNLNT